MGRKMLSGHLSQTQLHDGVLVAHSVGSFCRRARRRLERYGLSFIYVASALQGQLRELIDRTGGHRSLDDLPVLSSELVWIIEDTRTRGFIRRILVSYNRPDKILLIADTSDAKLREENERTTYYIPTRKGYLQMPTSAEAAKTRVVQIPSPMKTIEELFE